MFIRRLTVPAAALTLLVSVVAAASGATYSLEDLKALARASHPTLESAEAGVQAAEGAFRQSKAYPNPAIGLAAGRGRPRDGGDSRSEWSVELVQPIELPGLRRWRARAAELRLDGAAVDRELAGVMVDSTVTRLAYACLVEGRAVELGRESEAIALALRDLLERRAELGESSALEALRARSEWFSRRREVLEAEGSLEASRVALVAFFAGGLPGDFVLAEKLEALEPVDLPADLAARLRESNPILRRARSALAEAGARGELARKAVFPGFDLVAGHETELDRTASAVGVSLVIPLWHRDRGAVAEAASERLRVETEQRSLALDLERALGVARSRYESARAALGLHEEGWRETAERALEIATFSFENGEATLLELLDAQRTYLSVRRAEAEARGGLAVARAEIERLVAGDLHPEASHETR